MPRRVNEEEKIEMIIRGLLKLPENRRCINCNSLGPQYVCTTFWTFVCTNCSGVHREFTHRVKSVSMAKFNEEEITALQAGGNERAREIYFKAWDPQRNNYPDGSNLHKLREFIKHVYIDRKYAGENNSNKLSMIKLGSRNNSTERGSLRDDFLERSSFERSSNGTRDDFYERNSFEKSISPYKRNNNGKSIKDILEEKSPRYTQRSRPITRFEIVDDRFRDDGSVKHYERHSINKESQRRESLPSIRPVKEILGEKVPELKIGGPPKANNDRDKDDEGSSKGQKESNATIPEAIRGEQKKSKTVNLSSLIDFDAKSEAISDTSEPQTKPPALEKKDESKPISSSTTQMTANVNASNMNSVESLLFDWSAPEAAPSSGAPAAQMNSPKTADVKTTEVPQDLNSVGALAITATPVEVLNNQKLNKSSASDDPSLVQSEQSYQAARKEIPQELFTSNFTSFTPEMPGWRMHPPHGAGYGMQFLPPAMHIGAFQNPPRLRNPFDIGDDRFQVQAPMFPSVTSLQRALPNLPSSAALQSQPSSYATSHVSPYQMNMPPIPGAYMGQLPNAMPLTRPQENANFGRSEDAFASLLNPIQQTTGTESLPAATNPSLSRVGNPFG